MRWTTVPEPDEHLDDRLRDDRLRAAFGELGDRARSTVRPPGADRIPVIARRRRYAAMSGGTALLLAITGGLWLIREESPGFQPAAPSCAPVEARVFLPRDATADQVEQLRAAID